MSPIARAALLVAVVLLAAGAARADALSVRTLEFGTWGDAVATLESDVQGQGRAVHVTVADEQGRTQPCDSYELSLDDVAARAFRIDRCDPATNATAIVLVHRAALFAHGDVIPRPLGAGIRAVQTRRASAIGGATRTGGSDVTCTVAVRPYLLDLERGQRVYLAPGRFQLRPLATGIDVRREGAAFRLRAGTRAELAIDYEVVDTARDDAVVLRDRASLQCGATPLESVAPAPVAPIVVAAPVPLQRVATTCRDAPELRDGVSALGTTLNGSRRPLYRVALGESALLRLHLTSDFGGEIDLIRGCPGRNARVAESMVFGGGPDQEIAFDASGGEYYLAIVDADVHAHAGDFELAVADTGLGTPESDSGRARAQKLGSRLRLVARP